MGKKMSVSIVMPCYQAQTYLAQSIESILAQTHKEFEFIIVNDCSTDDSLDIIKHYMGKDKRIRLLDLPVNGGMSNARNSGNNIARGEIVVVQDADDVSLPERITKTVKFFEKNKDTHLVFSGYYVIDENNKVNGFADAQVFDINNVYEKALAYVGHPTTAYKRSVILRCPYQNGEWSRLGCEDFRMVTELWKKGYTIKPIMDKLVLYRWHSSNSTSNRNAEQVIALKKDYIANYLRGSNG